MESLHNEIRRKIDLLGPWYHNLEIVPEVWTNPKGGRWGKDYPQKRWDIIHPLLPEDISDRSILDIGCNTGFFCKELSLLGCKKCIGIEFDERLYNQAKLVREYSEADYDVHLMSVYDIDDLKQNFDLILFMGVIYHLRYPLLALDEIRKVLTGQMIIQSSVVGTGLNEIIPENIPHHEMQSIAEIPGFPATFFIEKSLSFNDHTNWWIPNPEGLKAMLRSSGFEITPYNESIIVCE